jgi:RHS repeat-associated protein
MAFNDMALVNTEGTVTPIYSAQKTMTLTATCDAGVSDCWAEVRHPQGAGWAHFTTTRYYHGDHLGSSRLMTAYEGFPIWEATYLPYGQEHAAGGAPPLAPGGQHYKFTGKERDTESGLDYFGARYYASALGRFVSPDPVLVNAAKHGDPQQWNMYGYVRDSPLVLLDPDGRDVKVLDKLALERIRQTVAENLRSSIKLDGKGFVDKASLDGVKTEDKNFNALKELANSSATIEVATAATANMGPGYEKSEFTFESVEQIVAEVKKKGFDVDPSKVIPTIFLGKTDEGKDTSSGNPRVTLSDGSGKAAGAPAVEHAVTAAHELYGHGVLLMRGGPWKHDQGGKVDQTIKDVEQRTRKLYEKTP